LKQGYKQTDIGLIPEDWEIKQIGEFTDAVAGGTPNTTIPEYWGGDIPWMSSGELNKRRVHSVDGRITKTGLENSSTHMIPENCVLVGLAGQGKTRGTVAINYISLCTNQSIAAIFPNDQVETEYLYQNLYSRYDELRELSSGDGGRGGLNLKLIKNLIVPIPPLPEQRRIAEALSDVDELIASLEKLIEKKKALKQGVMQELLTGKRRLPGFTGKWKKKRIKDIGIQIEKGQILTQQEATIGSIPVVAGGRQPAYYCDTFNRSGVNITISASGASAGFVNLYDGQIFASDCSTIGESPSYNIIFVYNALLNIQQKIYSVQTGGAQPHVHPSELYNLEIYYTFDVQEQTEIASILSDIENEIVEKERELQKFRKLKSGMMSELLTGRIRLV
jgi:type I restriction enzyme S subunit